MIKLQTLPTFEAVAFKTFRQGLLMHIRMAAKTLFSQPHKCFLLFMAVAARDFVFVFKRKACQRMIKFIIVDGHDIEVFTFMLCMAINTVPSDRCVEALIFFDPCHKPLVARLACSIRDPLA